MLVNLRSALSIRGYKQWEFALELRIPPSVLSEIIHERREASPELQGGIAKLLNADATWLFSRVPRIPPPERLGVPV